MSKMARVELPGVKKQNAAMTYLLYLLLITGLFLPSSGYGQSLQRGINQELQAK